MYLLAEPRNKCALARKPGIEQRERRPSRDDAGYRTGVALASVGASGFGEGGLDCIGDLAVCQGLDSLGLREGDLAGGCDAGGLMREGSRESIDLGAWGGAAGGTRRDMP